MGATAAQNVLFLAGLGISTCAVIDLIRRLLVQSRDASIIPLSESKPQYITQDVEDSLKLSTLHKLLDSPNFSIQETTSVIICERALHDENALDILLHHIAQPSYTLRERGTRALTMMTNYSTVQIISKPKTYLALVKSLEYCLTDYEHNKFDTEWDNWYLRDFVEQGCLMVLTQLCEHCGVDGLVKARFVERWLAKEQWGESTEERQLLFMDVLSKGDAQRLNTILLALVQNSEGRKQLEDSKLIPKTDPIPIRVNVFDTRMINGEGTAGEDFRAISMDRRRRRNQSVDDEHLRRRHREAMVLNDGTRPLERSDIFERAR